MLNFKGAIFDLDGTLLDSMDVWRKIDVAFLGKRGMDVPDDYIAAITPMGFQEAAEYTVKRFGLDEHPQDLMDEWNRMSINAYSTEIFLKPYVKEYLMLLKEKGIKLAVATACNEVLFVPALKNNGIYDLFDAFTTACEVGRGKGHPDIYLKAAQKIGLSPSDCVVFEDIYMGLKGAKEGGFFTVGVYDPYSDYEREKIKQIADRHILSFQELFVEE